MTGWPVTSVPSGLVQVWVGPVIVQMSVPSDSAPATHGISSEYSLVVSVPAAASAAVWEVSSWSVGLHVDVWVGWPGGVTAVMRDPASKV